jgi:hypothetical protein
VANGKLTGGFALVAYPVQYRNSDVMTFIVSNAGSVFQKDLGSNTAKVAEAMAPFDPDKTWTKVNSAEAAK